MERLRLERALLGKPGAVLETPFGPQALVYKVAGRMFALHGPERRTLGLKCDPHLAEILREAHAEITGANHMNKRHWISVALDGGVDETLIGQLIDQSYDLVVAKLTRAQRRALAGAAGG